MSVILLCKKITAEMTADNIHLTFNAVGKQRCHIHTCIYTYGLLMNMCNLHIHKFDKTLRWWSKHFVILFILSEIDVVYLVTYGILSADNHEYVVKSLLYV